MTNKQTTENMISDRFAYHHDQKTNAEKFYADEVIDEYINTNPQKGWIIILQLIEQSPSDIILANVAAGPLENFIRKNHRQYIDNIETQARKDQQFRRCLTGVWFGTDVPQDVIAIIQKYTSTVEHPL